MKLLFLLNLALAMTGEDYKNYVAQGLRDSVLETSIKYLNYQISIEEMLSETLIWNQGGWSSEERKLLSDVFSKRPLNNEISCLFLELQNCSFQTILFNEFPPYLENYDWLIISGKAYPKKEWPKIKALDIPQKIIFISEKQKPLNLFESPHKLKFPVAPPPLSNVSEDSNITTNSRFFDKRKTLLWTLGGILAAGLVLNLNQKKIVIDSSGLR